jgi:predicted metal-binding protein
MISEEIVSEDQFGVVDVLKVFTCTECDHERQIDTRWPIYTDSDGSVVGIASCEENPKPDVLAALRK